MTLWQLENVNDEVEKNRKKQNNKEKKEREEQKADTDIDRHTQSETLSG